MAQPIEVDLPHKLGKDEARRRIANNIHKLEDHFPGGAQIQSGWAGIEAWSGRPEWRDGVTLTRTVGDFPKRIAE